MSTGTESILFNALPLLLLAAAYAAVAGALVPVVWRDRAGAHPLDVAVVTIFPAISFAALVLALLVLHDRRAFGGHTWFSFVAVSVALAPAIMFLLRWGDRALVASGARRVREAEERVSLRDRELEAVAAISNELARARTPAAAARPLVRQVRELLGVGFGGVVLVDEAAREARGVFGETPEGDAAWWRELTLDLDEPSGIASAVFDAAPVAVYDAPSSPLVSPRLVELTKAKSGVWVPMIAEERVIGVLVAAATAEKRAFSQEEIALLQALAGEAALAVERMRSSEALADALEREQRVAEIARALRAQLEPAEVVAVARAEVKRALAADDVAVVVGEGDARGPDPVTLTVTRREPLSPGESFLVDTIAREVSGAMQTARLVGENQRRLEQQGALLHAAQVVTSELELDAVLQRLVLEVTNLLRADAADCYLLDRERNVLRCAAVHGLDPSLVGFEFSPDRGLSAVALQRERPVATDEYDRVEGGAVPHPAYGGFARALVAPMVWAGETRGVLGVGMRDAARTFDEADMDLLEAFAGLASLALRNAESFAERTRQARVQRAFYRIASLLGEPLSLAETLDAAAQAAVDAVGGDYGAVLMPERGQLALVGSYALPDEVRELTPPQALADAAADGSIVAASNVREDERLDGAWRAAGIASLLAIPVAGAARGLVVVFFREPRTFADDDLELARQLARAARGALERSRLYEAERTARSLSQQLARTGSLLATELDPAAVLAEVVEQAAALLGAAAGSVAALDHGELVVTAAIGEGTEAAIGARSPSTGWLGGDVVQSRAPVAYEDVSTDASLVEADPVLALGFRAYLAVPVAAGEAAPHGVLAVYDADPRAWREEEIDALAALAGNAAVALANAELYQRVAVEREQSVAILANIADGIVAVDRDGNVVVWNAAAEEITGVPAAEALGRTPAQVLQRDLESETGGTNRLVSIARGTEEVWLSLSEAVMRDPAGGVAGRIFAFRDISSERVVEQMKSDFVSTVSHELRTPLTSIYGFAETLLRQDIQFGEEERLTFLRYIASESERLTRIVDALLNVARLDTGDLQVALEPTDIGAVVSDAVSTVEANGTNGHRFEIAVEGGPLEAHADPDKLRQVLDQLVENAIKYSPHGGIVRVEARRRPDAVEVTVADEGVGIPASQRERIFSKFYRGGADTVGGTGLGLFIAHGLVSAMGGRIWVDSEEGRGSRFTFELPATRDE